MKQLNIAIIGGTGGMGKIFASELRKFGKIILCSRSLDKAKKVCKELGDHFEPRLNHQVQDADILIVAVPTNMMLKTCQDSLALMKQGSLLMDLSSVKTGLVDKLEIPPSIEYISCHPLFGPEGTLNEANIVLVPIIQKTWMEKIEKIFKEVNSVVSITSFRDHDEIMSKIQVMFHFANLCLVEAIDKSKISKKFYTRSFKLAQQLLKNFKKNLDVIFEIQEQNPFTKEAREFFHQQVTQLKDLPADEFVKRIRTSFSSIIDN